MDEPTEFHDKLTNYLILNVSEMSDLGVINGRMKAILYFFERSRKYSSIRYEELAIELLEEVFDILDSRPEIPVTFQTGLCGIGWMTEYLVQERFLGVDDDVCKKYDRRIWEGYSRQEYSGTGVREGICGFLFYSLARLQGTRVMRDKDTVSFHRMTIARLLNDLDRELDVQALLVEKDNESYDSGRLMICSEWEYPLFLLAMQHGLMLGVCNNRVLGLLNKLIKLLNKETWPKKTVNRELLRSVLSGFAGLNVCGRRISNLLSESEIATGEFPVQGNSSFLL